MGLQIELKPLVGTIVGGLVTDQAAKMEHDQDEILVLDVNGTSRRIGFCPHADGAAIRFVRIPNSQSQRDEVVAEVTRIRAERGLSTDTRTSQPPNPEELRAALKKERKS